MVIPWNALGVVGGAIVFIYDRTKDRREKAKLAQTALSVPPAPQFENGPADVALFTKYRGPELGVRHFDEDLKPGLWAALDSRGLRHVPPSELASSPEEAAALTALGSFYMVTPLQDGQTSAGETVRHCQESGGVVLGSLSLIALPVAPDAYPMLVAIGGPQLEKSANAAGEFAVLSKATEEAPAKTEPAPAAEVVPADEHGIVDDAALPDVKLQEHMNGSAKPEGKAVLGSVFELAKEEGH